MKNPTMILDVKQEINLMALAECDRFLKEALARGAINDLATGFSNGPAPRRIEIQTAMPIEFDPLITRAYTKNIEAITNQCRFNNDKASCLALYRAADRARDLLAALHVDDPQAFYFSLMATRQSNFFLPVVHK